VDAVWFHGDAPAVLAMAHRLASWRGPIVSLSAFPPGEASMPLARLVTERSISTNTAAAGGNASLMTLVA
jgi:RHH-type proline utilization regulon transcriptional repressor/proline dehydrogenase/delta 1-pyrroline-5-carboxylate dehydrogenase